MRVGLSSPHGLDVSVLLDVLAALGADVETYAVESSENIRYDVAVAVLTDGPVATTTAFDVGHAVGRGTPVLLLLAGPVQPPFAFGALALVRASLADRETLRLHLRLFLQAAVRTPQPATTTPSAGSPWALARLEELRRAAPSDSARRFESFVASVLADAGADVEQARVLDTGSEVDMVAAVPGYERALGVVLVEVKAGKPGSRKIDTAQRQLQEQVLSARAAMGVVVFDDSQGQPEGLQVTPRVVVIGIEHLLTELQRAPLADVLLALRNEAVHAL